jgi:hypothetical protein
MISSGAVPTQDGFWPNHGQRAAPTGNSPQMHINTSLSMPAFPVGLA